MIDPHSVLILQKAMAYCEAGHLAEAQKLCEQILCQYPNQAEALHLLGILTAQAGDLHGGIELIRRCIEVRPDWGEAQSNLANALRSAGRLDQAIAASRIAVKLMPENAIAHNNLGVALCDKGLAGEAIAAYRHALRLNPRYAEAHSNFGNALREAGQLEEGVAACQNALKINPQLAEAHRNLGDALNNLNRLDEAITAYRCALEINPRDPDAMNNLGICFATRGEQAAAIALFRRAVRLTPDFAEAHNNLGNALKTMGRIEEAESAYIRALGLNPRFAEARNNLGVALYDLGKLDDAHDAFMEALSLNPNYAQALNNLGNLLLERGQLDDGVRVFTRAIQLKPDLAEAYTNLGNALKAGGLLDKAIKVYERAMQLRPDNSRFHSNLVYAALFHPDYSSQKIRDSLGDWNRRHGQHQTANPTRYLNDASPNRPLRIGYISPNFRDHVIGRNILPLMREHDRSRFEIFCYARLNRRDHMTPLFEACCDGWRDITGLGDDRVAQLIAEDKIDILIDLAMHLSESVLPILALKPAPIQMTFAAYPGSTGLEAIDYRFTDPYLDKSGAGGGDYNEQSICLPETFWCHEPREILPVAELPALNNGHVTFGCLGEFCKINPPVLGLWAKVLARIKNSRLLVLAPVGESRHRVLECFRTLDIGAERLIFVSRQPQLEYLQTYDLIDIGLDTLPYNGHTTSLDALWMGVPVVTRVGETVVGRAGWSLLSNIGLRELAAQTDEEFIGIAANLAGDLPKLVNLRANLRGRMERSPLMDARRFTQGIENAYRSVWHHWCQKQNRPAQPKRVVVQIGPAVHRKPAKAA